MSVFGQVLVREGRKNREHLFKECSVWKKKIQTLWEEVGEVSIRQMTAQVKTAWNIREGFGYHVRGAREKGSNTPTRDLFANGACTSAVLELMFLRTRKVGIVRKGVLNRSQVYIAFLSPLLSPLLFLSGRTRCAQSRIYYPSA